MNGRALLGALVMLAPAALAHDGVEFPAGFQEFEAVTNLNQPVDMAFLPDGRLLVVEKAGRVWMLTDEVQAASPLLDLSEEVANTSSRGMKSIAVDPNFAANGNIYLLYEVDKHHLLYFGTPQYDPLVSDLTGATIGRVTRYSLDAGDNFDSVLLRSRTVLLGETISTGLPIVGLHETGALRFGDDGSLLVSCGDGSAGVQVAMGTAATAMAVAEGIITPEEEVGSFRAQMIDSLSGKILRLDPATGDGLAGNPYFVPGAPRSPRSRVWARGLRNPFRFSVTPGSSTGPGHPGRILIGDVGEALWEEFNISEVGGENFGWPLYEGMQKLDNFYDLEIENPLAPNPLFGQNIPGVGVCTEPFFKFKDLLVQETTNTPDFPNPCDPTQQLPASALPAVHTRPYIDWGHLGPARAKSFDGTGSATISLLGNPGSPIAGTQFLGSCSIGGAWSFGNNYPAPYDDGFFIADHTSDWIRLVKLDGSGTPYEILDFAEGMKQLVAMAVNPVSGDLYYLQFPGSIHQLSFNTGDMPPTASAFGSPRFAPGPSRVQFTSVGSSDPEGGPLTYSWDFGDGTPISQLANPVHIFPSADITPSGTIIAEVLELSPPQTPVALGLAPGVIADGSFANPGTGTMLENYLTFYSDPANSDPNDWIGYEYAGTHKFHQLVFQEGREFAPLGGWFDTLTVEARVNGIWTEVTNLEIYPPYTPNDGQPWETYELLFDSIEGDAIRLFGLGGGTEHFVSVGELRVISDPVVAAPARYDTNLTVRDMVNLTSQATAPIWINNTPPTVTIDSPLNGSTYDPFATENIALLSTSSDLESTPGELTCKWEVMLHHNDHVHPEPSITACDSSIQLAPHSSPGSTFYWEVRLTVSDPLGLSRTATSLLYDSPPILIAEDSALSLSEGGSAVYKLDAGIDRAGDTYWMLMNFSGIWPGFDWGNNVILPLNYDQLMLFCFQSPKNAVFTKFLFVFDSQGKGTAKFNVPPGSDPSLAGAVLNLAYIGSSTVGVIEYASNPVQLTFLP